ncbi:MAG TPA: fumarate hydratase C-terminal domain-containing protein, partial [Candidatus Limiplasma sp.]|nr:fumarate hydratase C-terminal domain-containing protein [Candidatus Limiplasma sp.]
EAIVRNSAVYLTASAGCAAYLSACVESVEVVAYDDLGTESIKRLTVRDLPLMVAIDCQGNDIYELGPRTYASKS